jgi:hypothetical protein
MASHPSRFKSLSTPLRTSRSSLFCVVAGLGCNDTNISGQRYQSYMQELRCPNRLSSWISRPLKTGLIRFPETLVRNRYTHSNNPEERWSQIYCCGSLKSHTTSNLGALNSHKRKNLLEKKINTYTHIHIHTCLLWRNSPTRALAASLLKFLDHTQWDTHTPGRTALNE